MRLFSDLGKAASVTLLFLLFAECYLHLAGIRFEGSFYQADRQLGYALRPHASGWNVLENPNYFSVNSDGMADREHAIHKPRNVIRIAVVGDSVSEAKQVRRADTYWAELERRLNETMLPSGIQVEVLNFGVAGYGLAQESIVIGSDRLWKYDPQLILLAGTIESFTLRTSRRLSPNSASERVPFYYLNSGLLAPDPQTEQERASFRAPGKLNKWFADAANMSRLLALTNEGLKKSAQDIKALLGKPAISSLYREEDSFLGPATADLSDAWNVSEALILRSKEEASRHHAEFWFFTLDMPQQVSPDFKARSEFEKNLPGHDAFISDNLFAQFAAGHEILHGTLAPRLLAFAQQHSLCLHGFAGTPRNSGHWNAAGHLEAGTLMVEQLAASSPLLRNVRH